MNKGFVENVIGYDKEHYFCSKMYFGKILHGYNDAASIFLPIFLDPDYSVVLWGDDGYKVVEVRKYFPFLIMTNRNFAVLPKSELDKVTLTKNLPVSIKTGYHQIYQTSPVSFVWKVIKSTKNPNLVLPIRSAKKIMDLFDATMVGPSRDILVSPFGNTMMKPTVESDLNKPDLPNVKRRPGRPRKTPLDTQPKVVYNVYIDTAKEEVTVDGQTVGSSGSHEGSPQKLS